MSKSFKKLVAIVSAIAMVIAGITVQPQTANAAEALEWSELTDGLGKATIKNTSTEEVRGAEYKGFETDMTIGKPLMLSLAFPPSHTVRATFTAHGVPSSSSRFTSSN